MSEEDPEAESLRDEVERLRSENANLRANLRIGPEARLGAGIQDDGSSPERPVRVLLLPDPTQPHDGGGPGPAVAANVARVLILNLRDRQPAFDWRAEHELAEVPESADCFQLGEVAVRMMGGAVSPPKTFRVKRDKERLVLSRVLVPGEPESDRFRERYEEQLRFTEELISEGQAAQDAGAEHHAMWTLKAIDVIIASLALGLAQLQAGTDEWNATLSSPRPGYDPRYHVTADMPVGS